MGRLKSRKGSILTVGSRFYHFPYKVNSTRESVILNELLGLGFSGTINRIKEK